MPSTGFREKFFAIFQRSHSQEECDNAGTDLALCRKIVELHGGHLRAESKVGVGSVFFLVSLLSVHFTWTLLQLIRTMGAP